MKKLLVGCFLSLLILQTAAQTDTTLNRRLREYTTYSKELNFDKLMDYLHPSLFEYVQREQFRELFANAYNNEQIAITIGTLENKTISESFTVKSSQYRKVDYFMIFDLKFKDESNLSDTSFINTLTRSLTEAYPTKKVVYDAAKKAFLIEGDDILIAIKDTPQSPWYFLGYDAKNELITKLFPKEVLEHFKLE